MKEFKGTKGEWKVFDYNGEGSCIDIAIDITKSAIAQVYSPTEICHNEKQTEEHKANAYLISAAPELLDSCINLLTLLTAFIEREEGNSSDFYEDVVNAKKAVNKALCL